MYFFLQMLFLPLVSKNVFVVMEQEKFTGGQIYHTPKYTVPDVPAFLAQKNVDE